MLINHVHDCMYPVNSEYAFLGFERSKCSKPGFCAERFEHAQNPARNMTAQNLAHPARAPQNFNQCN